MLDPELDRDCDSDSVGVIETVGVCEAPKEGDAVTLGAVQETVIAEVIVATAPPVLTS